MACATAAYAQNQDLQSLLVPAGADLAADRSDAGEGMVRVIVQFTQAPVARMSPNVDVSRSNRAVLTSHAESLKQQKAPALRTIARMGGTVQNTMEFVLNAAVVDMPANRIARLKEIAGVKSVRRAGMYQMNQAQPPSVGELIGTVPVNNAGNKGAGVAIAYLDSGVDYTHATFSGPGTVAFFNAAVAGTNATTLGAHNAGFFPNGPRVKGGYDWVGETWGVVNGVVVGAVSPDPNPIDRSGHGTHGASAAAGAAVPASLLRAGSAPEATLLAYKVCSSVSSSCEGSALLNSMESVMQYAAGNPNANQPGANNPALPPGTRYVINMSLGATYGNENIDDLSEASRNAVRAGITVVVSAGNSNDIPFIVGTPSATETVISVAASQPATLTGPTLTVGAPLNVSYPLITASFGVPLGSPLTASFGFAGPNQAVNANTNPACSGTLSGTANPGPAVPAIAALNAAIGISDRATCGFNEKALNTQRAGGAVALVVNNAVGAGPLGMGAGPAAPSTTIPSYSIGTSEGLAVKNALAATPGLQGTISPLGDAANIAAGVNLVDLISDFSSRGPGQNGFAAKPDITAPGSNIWMAAFGTGNRASVNSGTSFSAPLTSGIAALLLAARPTLTPWQVKAAIMNTANTDVFATKATGGNTLAGITRMGGGRVQADRAVATGTLAYDSADIDPTGAVYYNTALSFGPQAFVAAGATAVSRTVVVQNLGNSAKTYAISVANRFANDAAKGVAFTPSVASLNVAANSTATFNVIATATGSALPTSGGFPVKLLQTDTCTTTTNPPGRDAVCTSKFDDVERDGLVTIDGGPNDRVTVPYLMYPRAASRVGVTRVGTSMLASNTGVGNTVVDVFNLIGAQDPQDQSATPDRVNETLPIDLRALGVRYTPNAVAPPLPTGVTSGDVLEFAISMWRPADTWRITTFNIEVDINNDGVADFMVRNLNTTANRQAVFIAPVTPANPNGGANGGAFFSAGAMLSSTKMVLPVFASLLGVNANSSIGVRVKSSNGSTALGWPVSDTLPDSNTFMYFRPSALVNSPTVRSFVLNSGASGRFNFNSNAANLAASPGDKGLLLFYGDNLVTAETTALQLVP